MSSGASDGAASRAPSPSTDLKPFAAPGQRSAVQRFEEKQIGPC
jgi:hypothetical protein